MKKYSREYYEKLFQQYPDVVDTETCRQMMGGVGIGTVLKLIQDGHLQSIHYLEQRYLVPKVWLVDYLTGDHYRAFKKTLKVQV